MDRRSLVLLTWASFNFTLLLLFCSFLGLSQEIVSLEYINGLHTSAHFPEGGELDMITPSCHPICPAEVSSCCEAWWQLRPNVFKVCKRCCMVRMDTVVSCVFLLLNSFY